MYSKTSLIFGLVRGLVFRRPIKNVSLNNYKRYYTTYVKKTEPYITDELIYVEGNAYPRDKLTNVTPSILSKITRQLYLQQYHPISILRNRIESHFNKFHYFNSFNPIVTTIQNFDELGFPANHPGRSTTDSYYINKSIMLRTHTSAHQRQALQTGAEKFLISADVYRRDEIDTCHYPVFHQMEGVQIFSINKAIEEIAYDMQISTSQQHCHINTDDNTVISITNPIQSCHPIEIANAITSHLKYSLNELVKMLFIDEKNLQVRWVDAYFPFTSPSWEMEIFYQGKWLEVCGCGVITQDILNNAGQSDKIGWAFGLGLERIAMVLFNIPDIRLFWSKDPRFINQFTSNEIIKFKPFSKYPSCIKDLSFWMNNDKEHEFHITNFCEIVRDIAEDLVEDVKLVDDFMHPKTKKRSLCFRINYRSMDRTCTNEEINGIQDKIRKSVAEKLDVTLR
ncbi:phenylalanyl-tRNA synthetase [Gigaspora margarita]|uniref:Phenylalanine--tRNA ligase, mitochondrial n=2 Tax=Gigaspora margarita TaxID=4874 RepID=A0A8H3WZ82_GIGMA|nr:phenylalanyl-tRNA synthetase [Gigaspora margarita]